MHPSVRETLRYLKIDRGMEIHHDGDLPGRSGMGSSSAFTVGLLHALHALQGRAVGKKQLAERKHPSRTGGAEGNRRFAGPGLRGLRRREPHQLFAERRFHRAADDAHPGAAGGIEFAPDAVLHRHQAHGVGSGVELRGEHGGTRRAADADARLCGAKLRDFEQPAGPDGVWRTAAPGVAGQTRVERQGFQRARGRACSTRRAQAGAIGGKLLGAGGGGFILLFVPPEKQAKVRKAVQPADSSAV